MNNLMAPRAQSFSWFSWLMNLLILLVTGFTSKLIEFPQKIEALDNSLMSSCDDGSAESKTRRLSHSMAVSASKNSTAKIKVLVVENSPDCRRQIKNILLESNCDVVTAISSIDGLLCLKTGDFDTAFISVDLPVMDGISCAEKFRDWQDIILFTGGSEVEKPIKSTLIVGLIDDNSAGMYESEAIDVFVPLPLTKTTAEALVFPAGNLLSKKDVRVRPRSPLGQDQIGLFSCFYTPCAATQ